MEIFTNPGYSAKLPSISNGYFVSENYIIKMINQRLTLYQNSYNNVEHFEKLYQRQLIKLWKSNIIKLRNRKIRYKNNKYKKKEIWIINDKKNKAGDNGEYFFRYLINKDVKGLNIYYSIKKNCKDFKRLNNLGNILDLNSEKYLNIFLKSDKIISSVSDEWVTNPFGRNRDYIKDLFSFNFIFIKNGIIKDDFSKSLNKLDSNIKLFVASTIKEYNYLLSPKFGYNKNEVVLTGMPRFDNLEKHNKNKLDVNIKNIILVIPTWRKIIKTQKESLVFNKIHSDNFKSTKFYRFYNSLINDKFLTKIMKLYNYKGILCLHYNFAAQWIYFEKNDVFEIKESCDYQELIMESSLLITDYSSVFFDFGYLKKPIIYTHFDYEEYREQHVEEGFFNYQKDGFGPVCNNINSTINSIIESIKNNNTMNSKYLKRINNFFTFFDENNSERLFQQINKISHIKESKFSHYNLIILLMIISIILLKKCINLFSNN
jgi:CDP-glycerol glycerophosphotransferase (TagB/SpsB family)